MEAHLPPEADAVARALYQSLPKDYRNGLHVNGTHREQIGKSTAAPINDPRIRNPRKILIIGGGPAGIITLRELLNPSNHPVGSHLSEFEVVLYERREELGGVWFWEKDNERAKGWRKDSTNGSADTNGNTNSRWPTPAYDGLVGNVLPPLLEFAAKPIPKPAGGLFPSMIETHQYVLSLAEPRRSHVRLNTEVVSVQPLRHCENGLKWIVTARDWKEGGVYRVEEWDAIAVCTGAFDSPYYPDVFGLDSLHGSPLVMHAKYYPGPGPFIGQYNRVVVVGNANSANDIAAHLAPHNSDGPLYRSSRHESRFAHLPDPRIEDVSQIVELERDAVGTLTVRLESGQVLERITKVIFASGYEYRFEWIKVPIRSHDKLCREASKHGAVPELHQGTFVASAPSLAFVGLAAGSAPMPLAEIQARVVTRAFTGILPLPDEDRLLDDFWVRAKEIGMTEDKPENWRALHMVRGPAERKLTHALLEMLENSEEGSSSGLFRWDEWRETTIKNMRAIKEAELRRARGW